MSKHQTTVGIYLIFFLLLCLGFYSLLFSQHSFISTDLGNINFSQSTSTEGENSIDGSVEELRVTVDSLKKLDNNILEFKSTVRDLPFRCMNESEFANPQLTDQIKESLQQTNIILSQICSTTQSPKMLVIGNKNGNGAYITLFTPGADGKLVQKEIFNQDNIFFNMTTFQLLKWNQDDGLLFTLIEAKTQKSKSLYLMGKQSADATAGLIEYCEIEIDEQTLKKSIKYCKKIVEEKNSVYFKAEDLNI